MRDSDAHCILQGILTLIRLGFLGEVFSGRGWGIFQEKLIEYQYNFIQLLNNPFKVC